MNLIKKHINMNYDKGRVIKPQYIVIHETDNTNKGADAEAHYRYWNSNINANSSVHFVVDDKKAIQLLELNERAWHVGDNKGHSKITNDNSIGIEICVNADGDYNKAYNNAIELVRHLLKTTNMRHIVRHYDASGKHCPRRILDNNLWQDFINRCVTKEGEKMDKKAIVEQLEYLKNALNAQAADMLKELENNIKNIEGIQNYIKNH